MVQDQAVVLWLDQIQVLSLEILHVYSMQH